MSSATHAWTCGIVILLSVLQVVHASWWYLGVASSYQILADEVRYMPDTVCEELPYLQPHQRDICSDDERLLDVIREGAAMGIQECQHQFQDRRWNCSTFSNDTSVFGPVLRTKSRETAYIYAISSAGITYSVTRACSKGELSKCGCDKRAPRWQPAEGFEWGGCSDNVRYGARFAKKFVDSDETKRNERGSMNLWNNGAGRKMVKEEMRIVCKCHGVSGDCSVQVCWRKMKPFRRIGSLLKNKFDGASVVRWDHSRAKLKRITSLHKRPTKNDLVYLNESPDFCEFKPEKGSLGTRGRECQKESPGLDGCRLMCCGRGYQTLIEEEVHDCDCKFFWCCEVRCKQCRKLTEKHYCN